MNRKLAFSLLLGAFTLASWAQQAMTVKGTVKDSDSNPVIGATVVIKGTTQGTTTDIDGNYTIQAEPGQVLEFSYVGMQPSTVTVGNRNEINITMADGELLDEVVVIGYGTVKKSHLTGAVASVSGKELQASVARSASSALQGRIAGVTVSTPNGQPGEGMNINIRGISSMSSTTPLYVIDGVYGDINMVDPSDIQSLEVLKDASAASIYGSRAANGVVLITTKGGRLETPTRISVDAYTGIQSVAKYIDVMDGNQLRDFAKMTGYSTADELVNWSGGKGTDWQKELYGTAMVSKVGLNVSGGNKTSTYNLSGSYLKQDGIVKTTGYEAWNIRAKNTFSLFNNHVRMGSTIMMKFWQKDKESVSFTSPLTAVPMWKPYNEDGSWGQAPTWTRGDNPVGWAEAYDIQNHGTDILLNGFAEVDLGLKGLKYKFNVGINKYTRRNYNYTVPYVFSSTSQNPDYKLSEDTGWENSWLIENTINYDNTFGDHTVSGLVGYSSQKNSQRGFGAGRTGLPEGLNTIGAGSVSTQTTSGSAWANTMICMFGRVMYSYADRYMLSASIRRDGSSKFGKNNRYGNFPSASVGWNMAEEEFMENLSWLDQLKIRGGYGVLGNQEIDNYQYSSTITTGINYPDGNGGLIQGAFPKDFANPDIKWESTAMTNIGLDFVAFNNRLNITADWYVKNTKDILLTVPIPISSGGANDPIRNAGKIRNKGFEFNVAWNTNVNQDLSYGVSVLGSFNKNEVTAMGTGSQAIWGGATNQNINTCKTMAGYPIGSYWLIPTDGYFNSDSEVEAYSKDGTKIQPNAQAGDIRFKDTNDDGTIDDKDRVYCGSPFPDFTFSVSGNVTWKNFDASVTFQGVLGNKIYNATRQTLEDVTKGTNFLASTLDYWTPDNLNAAHPRLTWDDANRNTRAESDRYLENGSYLRLRNLQVGYTFPQQWFRGYIQKARVYANAENLFTITGYSGYTPDVNTDNARYRGFDNFIYPTNRVFMLGVNVTF